jgi:asparagine synthase (glutamine-hydrolysing)
MCGICGFYGLEDKNLLRRMCYVLRHRGPDDSGIYLDNNVGLGHQRLNVIDLKTGRQPIHNEDGSIWITYNGEIYNFQELRKELEAKHHNFYTNTDTEVVVHAYEEYGEDCVERFNGMFAFAIWDSKNKKFFLARDRIGKKPLYYTLVDGKFLFASEMKALLQYEELKREVDFEALNNYLTFLYILAPRSILKNIKKLPAAHTLTFKDGAIETKEYWDLRFEEKRSDKASIKKEIYALLEDAVRKRLISDVPLGAFLSGGLDSSIVVGLMSRIMDEPVKTFSIGFEEKCFDETKYARIVAEHFGTDHHEYIVKPDAIDILPKLVWYYDEPFADASAIPMYYITKIAKEKVTVVLTGDGGDESFAGYYRYRDYYLGKRYNVIPKGIRKILPKLVNTIPITKGRYNFVGYAKTFVNSFELPMEEKYLEYQSAFNNKMKESLYSYDFKREIINNNLFKPFLAKCRSCSTLSQMQYVDIKTSLPEDMLVKVDRMASANAIETRAPLLDYPLMEFAATLNPNLKLKGLNGKYILKQSVNELLPREIIKRKKAGFAVPIRDWFRSELKDLVNQVLLDRETLKRNYFDDNYIKKILDSHQKGTNDFSYHIWALLNLELWHRMFIDNENIYKPSLNLQSYIS